MDFAKFIFVHDRETKCEFRIYVWISAPCFVSSVHQISDVVVILNARTEFRIGLCTRLHLHLTLMQYN